MSKSADAFRTISEVADWLGIPAHVLRFWESKFTQVKPVKRAGGRRYYRPADMQLLGGIRKLLHDEGMTIKGVQKVMREQGVHHVAAMSPPLDTDLDTTVAGIALDVPEAEEEPRGQIVNFGRSQADAPTSKDKLAEPPKADAAPTDSTSDAPKESTAGASSSQETTDEDIAQEESISQDTAAPDLSLDTKDKSADESLATDQTAPIEETVKTAEYSDDALSEDVSREAGSRTSDEPKAENETATEQAANEDMDATPVATPKRTAQPTDPEDNGTKETDARPSAKPTETADDPSDSVPMPSSTLSLLARYHRKPAPKDAARIADITSRLTELRARMSGNAKSQ